MASELIDLRKEQEATLARPRMKYGLLAKLLFVGMDLLYGRKATLRKMRVLEILARIPYQAWEVRQYRRLDSRFDHDQYRVPAEEVLQWGRDAQDNEYWHLLLLREKMKQDGIGLSWFWDHFVPWAAVLQYRAASGLLALISIRAAWQLNAEFEDHAEHEYAQFVKEHPEMESQEVASDLVHDGRGPEDGRYANWADVFRRVGLDEREHSQASVKQLERGLKAPS